MTKKIREYVSKIDGLLESCDPTTDWDALSHEILVKIGFYQHERLVHLIVTMTVAILLVISVIAMFLISQAAPLALIALIAGFIILTAFYIVHYFKLENGVQDMYRYYDRVRERVKKR